MSFKVLWQWVLEVIYTLPLPGYVSLPFYLLAPVAHTHKLLPSPAHWHWFPDSVPQHSRFMASWSMEQHFWDSSRHQAAAGETEQSQWLEIQLVTRTACHIGRRCCQLGRGGSSNILPIRVHGGLQVLICWRAAGQRVAGCWWSKVLRAASSGTPPPVNTRRNRI